GADDLYASCGVRTDLASSTSHVIATAMQGDVDRDEAHVTWQGTVTGIAIIVAARADRTNGSVPGTGETAMRCNASGTTQVATVVNATTDVPDGQIGLTTFGVSAWFDYLFYVE